MAGWWLSFIWFFATGLGSVMRWLFNSKRYGCVCPCVGVPSPLWSLTHRRTIHRSSRQLDRCLWSSPHPNQWNPVRLLSEKNLFFFSQKQIAVYSAERRPSWYWDDMKVFVRYFCTWLAVFIRIGTGRLIANVLIRRWLFWVECRRKNSSCYQQGLTWIWKLSRFITYSSPHNCHRKTPQTHFRTEDN